MEMWKNFWGGLPRPFPCGEGGHPLPTPYPTHLGVCGASTLTPLALHLPPPNAIPGSAYVSGLFGFSLIGYCNSQRLLTESHHLDMVLD